jgi:putative oxidoreductase
MIRDVAVLAMRGVLGLGFASHGAQKAFGWFEGPGAEAAGGMMESLGFKPGARFARLSSYTEIGSGLAIALGLGGPVGPAALLAVMLVAQATVHAKNGFFAQKGGVELGVLYTLGAVGLAFSGPGRLSLDAAFGLDESILADERTVALVLAGGALGGWLALGQRER